MKTIQAAKNLNLLSDYVFSSLGKIVAEVEKKANRKVINFGIGSPDIPPKKEHIQKLTEFINLPDAHLYPGYGAITEFSEALIKWYKKRFNANIAENELLPLLGAKDGISHLPLALLNPGDEILVPDPGYPAFTYPSLIIGAKPVYYNLKGGNNFEIDLDELTEKISSKTKFIWINFPSNPTGQIATIDVLKKVVAFAKKHNLLIIYDNAYSEITFDGFVAPSILQIEGASDIAVEIGSFSKTFSFAGFRIGWIVGNKSIIAALSKVKSHMDSGLSLPLQKLGAYALNNFDDSWHQDMILSYKKRRDIIAEKLQKFGLTFSLPKGGLYIWAKIPSAYKNSEEFCMQLLKEKQILFAPGTAFGKNGERYIRVSICANIKNIESYFI